MSKRSFFFSEDVLRREQQKAERSFADRINRRISSLLARKIVEDATDAAMSNQWKSNNSWHIRADMPTHRVAEEPFSVRNNSMAQASDEHALATLERHQIGAINMKGKKSSDAVGQDSLSISCLQSVYGDDLWALYVVADGHGPGAHLVADRIVRTLPFFMGASECQHHLAEGQIEMAFSKAFERAEQDLYDGPDQYCHSAFAGTTATAILRGKEDMFFVASVGDSRAIMFRRNGALLSATADHKPERPEERSRIEAAGGVCTTKPPFIGMRIYDPDSNLGYPGLTVSRSFGDACAKKIGVIAQPEVLKWKTSTYPDAYLLVASDGIWEFLSDASVADFLAGLLRVGTSPAQAVKKLLDKAKEAWIENEDIYVDDITAILIPSASILSSKGASSRCGDECFGMCTIV